MQLEKDCILHGNGYALANRSGPKIVELIRLDPRSVTREVDLDTLEPIYRVSTKNGGQTNYFWNDVLHVLGTLDGLSPIRQCAESIGLCLSMEAHAGRLFGNGGRPSGVLQTPKRLGQDAYLRLKADIDDFSGNGPRANRTMILEEDMKFEPLTFNSVDLQFQELRAFQVTEIARALGVPPTLIFDYGRATWGNSTEMAQSFLTFGLLPRLKIWQGAIARLLSADEQKTHYAEFMVDELVKADIATRMEAYSKAVSARILSPNEVRAKENLPPYENGDVFENPNTSASESAAPPARSKPRAVA